MKFEKSLNKMRKSRDEFYYVSAIYYFQAMALRNLKEKSYYENFRNLLYKYGNRFSYIDRAIDFLISTGLTFIQYFRRFAH